MRKCKFQFLTESCSATCLQDLENRVGVLINFTVLYHYN